MAGNTLYNISETLESEVYPLEPLRGRICTIANQTAIARDVPLRVIGWQVEAAARFLEGKDQLVISKTGDGKTFCFLLAALCALERTIMVLTPLISLEECHVSMEDIGEVFESFERFVFVLRLLRLLMSEVLAADTDIVQQATATKYGLKSCALNARSLEEDPRIIEKIVAGTYQLVFVCPELLKGNHRVFQKLSKSKSFMTRMLGFVIDEVHLCHQW